MNGQVGFAERKINSQRSLNEYCFEIYRVRILYGDFIEVLTIIVLKCTV